MWVWVDHCWSCSVSPLIGAAHQATQFQEVSGHNNHTVYQYVPRNATLDSVDTKILSSTKGLPNKQSTQSNGSNGHTGMTPYPQTPVRTATQTYAPHPGSGPHLRDNVLHSNRSKSTNTLPRSKQGNIPQLSGQIQLSPEIKKKSPAGNNGKKQPPAIGTSKKQRTEMIKSRQRDPRQYSVLQSL